MIIDTHSHLYDAAYDADREECMARDRAAGIGAVVLPAIDSESNAALWALARSRPGYFYPLAGLHPTSVNDNPRWRDELAQVENLLAAIASNAAERPVDRIYGVGEIGLDLHWSREWEREQREAFGRLIELALGHDLPVVIHSRDAWPQMHEILGGFAERGLRGVMHAFSGTYDDYLRVKSCGDFRFGIGGVVTYKNNSLAEVVARMSPEDIVLESDAPYLTPVPHRGRRNESGYIVHTLARVAELLHISPGDLASVATANAKKVFGI
jgi:TatD DNase family protein